MDVSLLFSQNRRKRGTSVLYSIYKIMEGGRAVIRVPRRYSLAVLFLLVLCCAMLPLLAIYYTAHAYNVRLLREEVISSLQRQNQDFSDRLTDDISRIINTNYMLTQNWELGKLAIVPDEFTGFEKAQTFSSIQDKIYLAQLNSRFIETISVYFPGMDKCLSTNSSALMLSKMRAIATQLDALPQGQFFVYDGEMILLSENTFSSSATQANMVIQTTLSRRELLAFFKDQYWNDLSQGMVFSLHSADWPDQIAPDSLDAIFYQRISEQMRLQDKNRQQTGALQVEAEGKRYQLLYSYIPYAELILLRYFDIAQIDSSLGFSRSMLFLFAVVAGLSFALIYYALYRLVNRPLKTLLNGFARVEAGDFDFELDADTRGEFTHVYTGFSQMLAKLRVLMQQTYLQGKLVKRSEFKQLQAQIDPHFLYNGFFILNKRIRSGDTEGALAFSKLLSDYFRYVTQNARDIVPLQEEVAHAYNYARIQQIRFANRLSLLLDPVPAAYEQVQIPRLVLQPIVENVFRHVLDVAEGLTQLHISYHQVERNVEIWIEDSGTSITDEKLAAMRQALLRTQDEKEISGLTNVHMRLRLYYGANYGLFYEQSSMGGLLVRVRIPEQGGISLEAHPIG